MKVALVLVLVVVLAEFATSRMAEGPGDLPYEKKRLREQIAKVKKTVPKASVRGRRLTEFNSAFNACVKAELQDAALRKAIAACMIAAATGMVVGPQNAIVAFGSCALGFTSARAVSNARAAIICTMRAATNV